MLKLSKGDRNKYRRRRVSSIENARLNTSSKARIKWYVLGILGFFLLISAVTLIVDNHRIEVRRVTISHGQIPREFDGFRILQISDFHGDEFGSDNQRLIDVVNDLEYDIILLTGDYLSDAQSMKDFKAVRELLISLDNMEAPVYYILGENDDIPKSIKNRASNWNCCITPQPDNRVVAAMEELGATFVYPIQEITRGKARIFLTGISYQEKLFDKYNFDTEKDFTICVTHKPIDYDVNKRLEEVNQYSFKEVDFDLSISGHTLGGQYRLPMLGALYLDGYGLFPQESYAYGLHKNQGRYYYISAGLGTSGGFRTFNTPEIVLFELKCTEGKS